MDKIKFGKNDYMLIGFVVVMSFFWGMLMEVLW